MGSMLICPECKGPLEPDFNRRWADCGFCVHRYSFEDLAMRMDFPQRIPADLDVDLPKPAVPAP